MSKHVFTDSSGQIQLKRKPGRPRKLGTRPKPETDSDSDEKWRANLKAKLQAQHEAWELRQRRLYGIVYNHDPENPHKLLDGNAGISMAPEYMELLERSFENGDLVERADGFIENIDGKRFGWKNPSPHDFRVRAEDSITGGAPQPAVEQSETTQEKSDGTGKATKSAGRDFA
jgi:hypothetical protein